MVCSRCDNHHHLSVKRVFCLFFGRCNFFLLFCLRKHELPSQQQHMPLIPALGRWFAVNLINRASSMTAKDYTMQYDTSNFLTFKFLNPIIEVLNKDSILNFKMLNVPHRTLHPSSQQVGEEKGSYQIYIVRSRLLEVTPKVGLIDDLKEN